MQYTDIFGGGHVCENQRCHQKVTVIHVVFNPSDFMNGHDGVSILRLRGLSRVCGRGVTSVEDVSLAMVVQIAGSRTPAAKSANFFHLQFDLYQEFILDSQVTLFRLALW